MRLELTLLKRGVTPFFRKLALFGPSPGEPVSTRPVRRIPVSRSAAPRDAREHVRR
jgi:hypothetical protein